MHAVSEVHDTSFSWPPPLGVGVAWIDQLAPSQASASVWDTKPEHCAGG